MPTSSEFQSPPGDDLPPGVRVGEDGRRYASLAHIRSIHQRNGDLSRLMMVSRSLMAERDLDSLLRRIVESVKEVMHADLASLFLVDKERNELVSRVTLDGSVIHVPMGKGLVGHVAATGEVINIPEAYEDPRFNQQTDRETGYRTKSILCMPVRNHAGEILGAIQVLNKLDGEHFTENDENLLEAFISLAAISLENAHAYEALERERASLEVRVKERTAELAKAVEKSDELLLNILPKDTADELKEHGSAAPRLYDMVTVLFTDFKGFTEVAQQVSPESLISELDRCFFYFDEVAQRYKLEKIKTIGDAYMCAGGIPRPNRGNPVDVILAALEIQSFMNQMREIKKSLGEPFWELRLGIHTGPVISGVVGKHKFAFDIWGDTVNTAARMEAGGVTGRVNISETTYRLVKSFFTTEYRGRFNVKNKGVMDMFFVNSIRPELAQDDEGRLPNDRFWMRYQTL